MKNIFAFDLDGTLLDQKQEVTDSVREALEIIESKGDYSVINTGRHYLTTKHISEQSGIKYSVNLNGTAVYDFNKNKYLSLSKFGNDEDIMDILKFCEIRKHSLFIYSESKIIHWKLGKRTSSIDGFFHKHLTDEEYPMVKFETAEEMFEWIKENNISYTKFIINSDDISEYGKQDFVKDVFDALADVGEIYIGSEGPSQMEVSLKGTSKYTGLVNFINIMDLNDEAKIIAFGDSYNDIGLFDNADVSYVMDSAPNDVKRRATNITDSNVNNGILNGVKHFYKHYNN